MDILLGYEDPETDRTALELAVRHAKAFNAKVYIVTSMMGGGEGSEETFLGAEQVLEKAQKRFVEDKLDCETLLLVRGLGPGEDLVKFAEEKRIEEIIIGIKKKSKLGKLLFGSNAQHVILNAPCPVVSVK